VKEEGHRYSEKLAEQKQRLLAIICRQEEQMKIIMKEITHLLAASSARRSEAKQVTAR
jgi:hypothetical protein